IITDDCMTRAPVFVLESATDYDRVVSWITKNFNELKRVAEAGRSHLKLNEVKPFLVGRNLFLRFSFDPGDAMGMNSVTLGTSKACDLLSKELGLRLVALSGNLCVDKKPSALNLILGRGKSVVAECVIPKRVVKDVLKTSPELIVDANYRKNLVGSAKAGSFGFNAHYANVLAAIFIATGQDAAQVVDASQGFTTAEMQGEDLYFSVSLPCLSVGTVGGGTGLSTQRECLALIGFSGGGDPPGSNAKGFAEVIASAVLAGELSLMAALTSGNLSTAHAELGRKGKE
ncbi:MAG: hydroxymethylglutaryl-CoA reductase, partial [Candidatus Diapherotrites archaeon]|nr:hydroxymethylglutaryl-CoA reductase [Candidatus Diapherotrites archaeon]